MPAYSGKNLYINWIYSGGTVTISGDYRTLDYTPSIDLYDQTAGSDEAKTYITGVKSGQAKLVALMQAGGTAVSNALAEGNEGTLIVGPEGTATGKQKLTIPAIAMGAKVRIPYNNNVELSCDFTQNGARVDGSF